MSETFVYREVLALREMGFDIPVYANRRTDIASLPDEAKPLVTDTEYIFPVSNVGLLVALVWWFVRHPFRFYETVGSILFQKHESSAHHKRTIQHWIGGVYLAHKARKRGIDHIHAHFSVNAATIGLTMAILLKKPFSFTVHNNIFYDRLILRQKLKRAKFISCISHYSKQWMIDFAPDLPDLDDKIKIVRCGIDPTKFDPALLPDAPENDVPVIFTLARLAEMKGMRYLVDACKILKDRGVQFHCIIGGDGEEEANLRSQIEQDNLQDVVTMAGRIWQEDLPPYFAKADVFSLACCTAKDGQTDGIPVSLMESMAMAIPTVSTTVSGIPELIEDGVSGFLVGEKDPEALADVLERLILDAGLRNEIGGNAREKVVSEFDVRGSAETIAKLFHKT